MADQKLSPEEIGAPLSCALNKTRKAKPWTDTDLQVAGKLIGKRLMQTVKPGTADNVEFYADGYHAIVALSVTDLPAG